MGCGAMYAKNGTTNTAPEAPHDNKEVDEHLKEVAQRAFEEKHSHELWMQEFGKNYLEGDED